MLVSWSKVPKAEVAAPKAASRRASWIRHWLWNSPRSWDRRIAWRLNIPKSRTSVQVSTTSPHSVDPQHYQCVRKRGSSALNRQPQTMHQSHSSKNPWTNWLHLLWIAHLRQESPFPGSISCPTNGCFRSWARTHGTGVLGGLGAIASLWKPWDMTRDLQAADCLCVKLPQGFLLTCFLLIYGLFYGDFTCDARKMILSVRRVRRVLLISTFLQPLWFTGKIKKNLGMPPSWAMENPAGRMDRNHCYNRPSTGSSK